MIGNSDNSMYGMYPRPATGCGEGFEPSPDVVTCDSRDDTGLHWDLVAHSVDYGVMRRRQNRQVAATANHETVALRRLIEAAFNGGPLPETPWS